MKWFITQDIGNITQRLIDAGETVISTPDLHRDPDDPDMEEPKDYPLARIIRDAGDFDVLFLGNVNQFPFYSKGAPMLWMRKGGHVLMGGNDFDPRGLFNNNNRMIRCTITMKHLSVYATNDPSVKPRLPPRLRVWDMNGDIASLIQAAKDTLKTHGMGKLYV
tara:strand:- start:309 stop:797 length:489 start_codon:yes stop_codon:yes gene_type:complete